MDASAYRFYTPSASTAAAVLNNGQVEVTRGLIHSVASTAPAHIVGAPSPGIYGNEAQWNAASSACIFYATPTFDINEALPSYSGEGQADPASSASSSGGGRAAEPDTIDFGNVARSLVRTLRRGGLDLPFTVAPEDDYYAWSARIFGPASTIRRSPALPSTLPSPALAAVQGPPRAASMICWSALPSILPAPALAAVQGPHRSASTMWWSPALPSTLPALQGDPRTELCMRWRRSGTCHRGSVCPFAHGVAELRNIHRPLQYKTKLCRNFPRCPYADRCQFKHE
jgi:hypothetical protein